MSNEPRPECQHCNSFIDAVMAELEGLKDTVSSQARLIGQLKHAAEKAGPRIQTLNEAKNQAARWERLALKRMRVIQGMIAHLTESKTKADALIKDLHAGLTDAGC